MAAIAPTARTFELVATIADRLALEFDDTVAAMDAPSRVAASTWTQSMRGIDAANRSRFSAGWPVHTKSSSRAPI